MCLAVRTGHYHLYCVLCLLAPSAKMRLEMIIHSICRRHATFLYLTQFVKLVFTLDVSVVFYDKMNDLLVSD